MKKQKIIDLAYETRDYKNGWQDIVVREMWVTYEDGTSYTLSINLYSPEDVLEEKEWYIMIYESNNVQDIMNAVNKRLEHVLEHEWSNKSIYYTLNNETIYLTK